MIAIRILTDAIKSLQAQKKDIDERVLDAQNRSASLLEEQNKLATEISDIQNAITKIQKP